MSTIRRWFAQSNAADPHLPVIESDFTLLQACPSAIPIGGRVCTSMRKRAKSCKNSRKPASATGWSGNWYEHRAPAGKFRAESDRRPHLSRELLKTICYPGSSPLRSNRSVASMRQSSLQLLRGRGNRRCRRRVAVAEPAAKPQPAYSG
jgi:hypothetical protein